MLVSIAIIASRRKNDTAPALELFFYEHGFGALGFHECGSSSGALFFHGSGFCSFSHISSFNCLGVPQLEWKMNCIKYTKPREYTKLLSNLIW